MLTLSQLQRIVEKPEQGEQTPTAKCLKEDSVPVIFKRLSRDAQITVYSTGYVLYQVCRRTTVFPLHSCGDYLYLSGNSGARMPKVFFEKEPWYIRLILEGEDRIDGNRNRKEQSRTISYSPVSEEWKAVEDKRESMLETLVRQEMLGEMMRVLTTKQQAVLQAFYFQEKTQDQIAREQNISRTDVSSLIFNAIQAIRKRYLAEAQHFQKNDISRIVSNTQYDQHKNRYGQERIHTAGRMG